MAVIPLTENFSSSHVARISWVLGNADTGQPLELPRFSDKSWHVYGTFGGATVTLEGSNDPRAATDYINGTSNASWVPCKDPTNTAITAISDEGDQLLTNFRFIRPKSAGGTGTSVTVAIMAGVRKS